MVAMFGRTRSEGGLDARIAELSAAMRRSKRSASPASRRPKSPPRPILAEAQALSSEDGLARARDELTARLAAEIRPERRALLSRGDLANMVEAAVQAYWVRHAIDAGPVARRDLVADIMERLATPGDGEGKRDEAATGRPSRRPRRRSSR